MQCVKAKKNIIFHILYIIVAPFSPAFLEHLNFYKAHRSEKHSVLWLDSYPVHVIGWIPQVCDRNFSPLTIFRNTQLLCPKSLTRSLIH